MTVSLLSGLFQLPLKSNLKEWISDGADQGSVAAAIGKEIACNEFRMRIKQETEEYILSKAASMNLHLSANVTLSDTDFPEPTAVTIFAAAPPGIRKELEQIISQDLGISKENQLWMDIRSEAE